VAPEFCADKSRTLRQIRAELERRDVWQGSKWGGGGGEQGKQATGNRQQATGK
jgi:hypothetical protein